MGDIGTNRMRFDVLPLEPANAPEPTHDATARTTAGTTGQADPGTDGSVRDRVSGRARPATRV